MQYYENLGLDSLFDTDEAFEGMIRYVCHEGKETMGYWGLPYFNLVCSAPEFVVRTAKSDIGLEVSGFEVHVSGRCVWELEYLGIDLRDDHEEPTQFRGVFRNPEKGTGMVPVELIKADVLPGLVEYDKVKMQVAAFADYIAYYESEEDYAEAMPRNDLGKTLLLEDGMIFPVGLFRGDDDEMPGNEMPAAEKTDDENPTNPSRMEDRSVVLVKGVAKGVYNGIFEAGIL